MTECSNCEDLLCEWCVESEAFVCRGGLCDDTVVCNECVARSTAVKTCRECDQQVCSACAEALFYVCEGLHTHVVPLCAVHPMAQSHMLFCGECHTLRCVVHAATDFHDCAFCNEPTCHVCDNNAAEAVRAVHGDILPAAYVSLSLSLLCGS